MSSSDMNGAGAGRAEQRSGSGDMLMTKAQKKAIAEADAVYRRVADSPNADRNKAKRPDAA